MDSQEDSRWQLNSEQNRNGESTDSSHSIQLPHY